MKTKYEEYVEKQMQDPEFRAYYILAKEKAKLEFMLADLQDTINTNFNKNIILRNVKKIGNYVNKIGLY
ncbi:MAG: hypothetical protein ABSG15_07715 [FCB group bacterium]|jgi:hypothetical protein